MAAITGLGRPIDPRLPSNRHAVAASAAAGAVAFLVVIVGGDGLGDALRWGVRGGLASFLAWATARELDPNHPASAAIAAPVALVALLAGPPSLFAVAAALLATRIVVRTTGLWPTWPDLVAMVGLAGLAGWQAHGVWAGVALAGALAIDTRLPRPAPVRSLAVAGAALASALLAAAVGDGIGGGWEAPGLEQVLVLGLGAAGVLGLRTGVGDSTGDSTARPLDDTRLRAGRLVAAAILLATGLAAGGPGIAALSPLGAAFAAGAGRALVSNTGDRAAAGSRR